MSQRAAWQLERLGFTDVSDFVVGKSYWLATGRPTIRSQPIARVGSQVTPSMTALTNDSVAEVRDSTAGDRHTRKLEPVLESTDGKSDVVVVDEHGIVLGRVRHSDLEAAASTDLMSDIMRLGPTTIRPDQLVRNVAKRMENRGVRSLLVTRPTGELIGEFVTDGVPGDG